MTALIEGDGVDAEPSSASQGLQVPDTACPPLPEWASLLLGERARCPARHRLLDHLLRPCATCWQKVAQLATSWDIATLPLDNAPSMAVHAAALGMAGRPVGRLALMRPLHRRDAFRASDCRQAFCRLLLHEAMAASRRPQALGNPETPAKVSMDPAPKVPDDAPIPEGAARSVRPYLQLDILLAAEPSSWSHPVQVLPTCPTIGVRRRSEADPTGDKRSAKRSTP